MTKLSAINYHDWSAFTELDTESTLALMDMANEWRKRNQAERLLRIERNTLQNLSCQRRGD